jgi:hypothetical protein
VALALAKHQRPALGLDPHRVARTELAGQDLLRQRILQLLLDRALERTRAVDRIEADVAEQQQRGFGDLQPDLAFGQALAQVLRLERAISRICPLPSGWNTTISSRRLMNSGRKCACTTPITAAFIWV